VRKKKATKDRGPLKKVGSRESSTFPSFADLFNPILQALRALGNSAALGELEERIAQIAGFSEEMLAEPHVRHRGSSREYISASSEFSYRTRWALTYLKKAGLVTNSVRGVWALTELGLRTEKVDRRAIVSKVRASEVASTDDVVNEQGETAEEEASWSDSLMELLLDLTAAAFERLAQRLLREAGFTEVKVEGRSGDGGIDGRGVLRLNDLVSMNAIFQCKRYRSNVGPAEIREFRGALAGRADRGIFVTTSSFTPAAMSEASRDGVTPIDLVDGERLVNLLKQFRLGVKVEMVESVLIDKDWFKAI